jgi:hypothetical protein
VSPLATLSHYDEWYDAALGEGLHPRLDGSLELTPDNLADNQYFISIDDFGDAEGYPFRIPDSPDGIMVAVSTAGGAESTMTFQSLTPHSLENPGWVGAQPIINGRRPVQNPALQAKLPRPLAPRLSDVSTGRTGFAGGTRRFRYTLVTREGRHTTPSPAAVFSHSNGQAIRFTLPAEVPEGLRIGIYLSEAGKGDATMRLQRVVDPQRGEVTLTGPFRTNGRRLPTRNETYLGRPPAYRFGRTVKRDRYVHDLKEGEWRFAATYGTEFGESAASTTPDSRYVEGETVMRPIEEPAEGGPTHEEVALGYVRKEAWWVERPPRRKGARRWHLYAQIDGQWYRVHFGPHAVRGAAQSFNYAGRDKPVPVGGVEGNTRFILTQTDPPIEDTSGIEGPTQAPDAPVGVGKSFPDAGTYRAAYAFSRGDEIGPLSPSARRTISLGRALRLGFPHPLNLIPNAEGSERDPDGLPYDWTIIQTNGTYALEGGKHVLTTAGAVSAGTPIAESARVEVSQDKPYTVAWALEVAAVAGDGRLLLRQYRTDDTFVDTTLASITGTDYHEGQRTFMPGELDANTISFSVRLAMAGTTKNMTLKGYHLGIFPMEYAPRKVERGEPRRPASFNASPEQPYPLSAIYAVGPAPGPVDVEAEAPLAEVSFEDGVLPAGWTHTQNPSGNVSEVTAAAAIDGSYGWRVEDLTQTTSGAEVSLQRTFTDDSRLALLFKVRVRQRPNWTGAYVALAQLREAGGPRLVELRLYSGGGLRLAAIDRNNSVRETYLAGVPEGSVAEVEVIASGAGTADGTVDGLVGVDGAQRTLRDTLSAIDWRGLQAGRTHFGICRESDTRAQSRLDFDSVVVTRRGPLLTERPPSTQTFVPDRPARDYPAWAAKTTYAAASEITPSPTNYRYYTAEGAGTSGPNQPAFPQEGTVTDNAGLVAVARSTVYAVGDGVLAPTPTDTEWYEATAVTGTATTAATAPAYPTTEGATVLDGEVTFTCRKTVTWRHAGSTLIEHDPEGELINQMYLFVPPGTLEEEIGLQDVPLTAVKPEQTYTVSLPGRHKMPASSEPWHPWTLYLTNRDGDIHELGSLYGAAGCSGTSAWQERAMTFTVPATFTELRATFEGFPARGGEFVWQGPVKISEGLEAKEGYGKHVGGAGPGTFTLTLLGRTPDLSEVDPSLDAGWYEMFLRSEELPEGATLAGRFRSGDDLIAWGAWEQYGNLVAPATYGQVEGTLSGDGRVGPLVGLQSAGIAMRIAAPTLLLDGRRSLPGGCFLDGLELGPLRPEHDVSRVAGHVRSVRTTAPVRNLPPFKGYVLNERAALILEETEPDEELVIEAPWHGNRVVMRIVAGQEIDVEETGHPIYLQGGRRVWGEFEIERAEVLEMGRL